MTRDEMIKFIKEELEDAYKCRALLPKAEASLQEEGKPLSTDELRALHSHHERRIRRLQGQLQLIQDAPPDAEPE